MGEGNDHSIGEPNDNADAEPSLVKFHSQSCENGKLASHCLQVAETEFNCDYVVLLSGRNTNVGTYRNARV